ncbi:hypothetical protein [Siccirubricoccus deserti]|nr:hypothetical protein [Siccirubricoccus deserti]
MPKDGLLQGLEQTLQHSPQVSIAMRVLNGMAEFGLPKAQRMA